MSKYNSLLQTNSEGIEKILTAWLKKQGSNPSVTHDTNSTLQALKNGNYGLVIIDGNTSTGSDIQKNAKGAQVVFLCDNNTNNVSGNVITKPFSLSELLKYTKNAANDIRFRNSETDAAQDVPDDDEGNQTVKPEDVTSRFGNVIQIGDVKFEPSTRTLVTRGGKAFKIPSEVQCEILKALGENGLNTPVNYETIFARIDKVSPKADGSRRTMTNVADRKTLQNIVKKMRVYLAPQGLDFRSTGNGYVLVQTNTPSQEPMNESRINGIITKVVNESLKRMINEKFSNNVTYDNDLDYETVYYEALHFISNNPQNSQSWREIANGIGFRMETMGQNDMETVKDAIEDAMSDSY